MTSFLDDTQDQTDQFDADFVSYFSLKNTRAFFLEASEAVESSGESYDTIIRAMKARKKYMPDSPIEWKLFFRTDHLAAGLASYVKYIQNATNGFIFCLQGLSEVDWVIMTHKNNPSFIRQLQGWVDWYYEHKFNLMVVNYGPYHFTPLVNIRAFFKSFCAYLKENEAYQSQSFLSLSSPAWFGFAKWLKEKYGVNILPNQQQIDDGRSVYNAVERVYRVENRESSIQRPKEYFLWGYKSKFLWDLENVPLFRQAQFKADPAMEVKYKELGGVSEEFIDWIRTR